MHFDIINLLGGVLPPFYFCVGKRCTGAYSEILSAMYGISDRLRKTLAEIRLSLQQVNMGAEQFASVEELTANAEEIVKQVNTTAASEELSGQANLMEQMVSQFKI